CTGGRSEAVRSPSPTSRRVERAIRQQPSRRDQGRRRRRARAGTRSAGRKIHGRKAENSMTTFVEPTVVPPQRPPAMRLEVQELKFLLHRKLLDKINLEALALFDTKRAKSEVQQALFALMDNEPTLLTGAERDQIADEVLHEVFGLGPLELLLDDN